MLSLETHLGVTASPQAPFPTDYVTLPVSTSHRRFGSLPLAAEEGHAPTLQRQFLRGLHSKHAQATSPPYGRATLAGRTPGDVPRPEPIWRRRTMTGHHMPRRLSRTASAVLLRSTAQHPIKARFRCQIYAAVRKTRYDLTGRQAREFGAIGHLENLLPFGLAQFVTWLRPNGRTAAIGACGVAVTNPALERSCAQAKLCARPVQAAARAHRLADQRYA